MLAQSGTMGCVGVRVDAKRDPCDTATHRFLFKTEWQTQNIKHRLVVIEYQSEFDQQLKRFCIVLHP